MHIHTHTHKHTRYNSFPFLTLLHVPTNPEQKERRPPLRVCVKVPLRDGTVGDAKRALLALLLSQAQEQEGEEQGEGAYTFLFYR